MDEANLISIIKDVTFGLDDENEEKPTSFSV